jgi:hypothetical protein
MNIYFYKTNRCKLSSRLAALTVAAVLAGASAMGADSKAIRYPGSLPLVSSFQSCSGGLCVTGGQTMTFTFAQGASTPQIETATLSATGSSFPYSTSITAGNFPTGGLTITSGATGTVSNGGIAQISVQVDPTVLTPGVYSGSIAVLSGSQSVTITVSASLGNALVPTFSSTGSAPFSPVTAPLSFSLPAGQGTTGVGTLDINAVSNANVSAPMITYTPGSSGWLSDAFIGCNGTVGAAGGATCANILSINTTGLTGGYFSASIVFTSTTSGVAALNLQVSLTVTGGPMIQQVAGVTASTTPTNLVFRQGANQPPSSGNEQTVEFNVNAGSVTNLNVIPSSNGSWLGICKGVNCTPSTAALTGQTFTTTPTSYVVGVDTTNLTAGVNYSGSITVVNGNSLFTVPVSVLVTAEHRTSPGVFRSSNGYWLLDSNFDNQFDSGDTFTCFCGNGLTPQASDIPVAGDWNGSGTAKIGLYRPSTGTWFLDYNGNGVFDGPGIDKQYQYGGIAGDIPVVGDWNGTGYTKIGLFRAGFLWLLNVGGSGVFTGDVSNDYVFPFGGITGCSGLPGVYNTEPAGSCDIPVVGDWDLSGSAKVGVVRAAPGSSQPFLWILDTTGAQAYVPSGPLASTVFAFGGIPGDVPLVGDWTNSGNTNVGLVREGFLWLEDTTADLPAAPTGTDTLVVFPFGGVAGDKPVAGRW